MGDLSYRSFTLRQNDVSLNNNGSKPSETDYSVICYNQHWEMSSMIENKGGVTKTVANDSVLQSLIRRLQERLGSNLTEVWLFGSRARGDHSSDSDYDILIVADGDINNIREIVSEEEYRLLQSDEELVVSIAYTPEKWSLDENSPLGWNIRKEGIRLV